LGVAYIKGMTYAMNQLSADVTIEMDADFQHNPKYLTGMISAFLNGADDVIGSRFILGGSIPAG
jgi:dolichol-phosphate mannosyltransferase